MGRANQGKLLRLHASVTTVSPALWMHDFHDRPHSLGSGMRERDYNALMHAKYCILHQMMACSFK